MLRLPRNVPYNAQCNRINDIDPRSAAHSSLESRRIIQREMIKTFDKYQDEKKKVFDIYAHDVRYNTVSVIKLLDMRLGKVFSNQIGKMIANIYLSTI